MKSAKSFYKARREADGQRFRETSTEKRSNFRQRASQRIQNETEEETEARRKDAKQRVSQKIQIQNETEDETEPIIFYLYLTKL